MQQYQAAIPIHRKREKIAIGLLDEQKSKLGTPRVTLRNNGYSSDKLYTSIRQVLYTSVYTSMYIAMQFSRTHLVRLADDLEALFGLLGVISVLVRVPFERLSIGYIGGRFVRKKKTENSMAGKLLLSGRRVGESI